MIFSTGQVVYCLCYSLFLNSNNDIFQKIMANFSELSYLALNIFSSVKASQFNFSENLTFKEHCFAQSPTELLSYQVSRQQHYILDKLKKSNCGSFLCNIPLFLRHLRLCHNGFHDLWANEEDQCCHWASTIGPSLLYRHIQTRHQEQGNVVGCLYPESRDDDSRKVRQGRCRFLVVAIEYDSPCDKKIKYKGVRVIYENIKIFKYEAIINCN